MNMFNLSWLKNANKVQKVAETASLVIFSTKEDGENKNGDYMLNFRWNKLLKNRSNLTTNSTLLQWGGEHILVSTKDLWNF